MAMAKSKTQPQTSKPKPAPGSPKKKARANLPSYVIAYVWARAAGRCEFLGCNSPVWKDVLTTKEVNVGKLAHIVGAKVDGPRGDPIESPKLEKDPSNIMLLCGTHHDLVDNKKYEATYPVDLLRSYKAAHAARIERLTAIDIDRKSVPILVEIPVGAYTLQTTPAELALAIADEGYYPDDTRKIWIDLNGMTGRDHDTAFWSEARKRVGDTLERQLESIKHSGPLGHASVLAFGPMPLLIFLGHLLDEKIPARVYNRVRVPEGWTWPKDARRVTQFVVTPPAATNLGGEVAIVLSVTSRVQREHLAQCVPASMPVFELDWSNPSLDCLRSPAELAEFVVAARDMMEAIHRAQASKVHVFPAVPVAAAVEFGRLLQKKLHPPLALYDYHQATGGWRYAFDLVARRT
jgi:hypothetical protein